MLALGRPVPSSVAAPRQEADCRIRNGSFESGLAPWVAGSGGVAVSEDEAHTGQRSLKFGDAPTRTHVVTQTIVAAPNLGTRRLTYWAHDTSVTIVAVLEMFLDNQLIEGVTFVLFGPNDWTEFSTDVDLSSVAAGPHVFRLRLTTDDQSYIHLDDIQLDLCALEATPTSTGEVPTPTATPTTTQVPPDLTVTLTLPVPGTPSTPPPTTATATSEVPHPTPSPDLRWRIYLPLLVNRHPFDG
jgi:hypothetical protein